MSKGLYDIQSFINSLLAVKHFFYDFISIPEGVNLKGLWKSTKC